MLAANGVKCQVNADIAIQHKLHAAKFQLFDALHDHGFFQFETGDTVSQQPARAIIAVINGDLDTAAAQHIGCGQTAGASANDAHRFNAFSMGANGFDPAHFPRLVCQILFNRPNGNRAMPRLFDHAIAFTQAILGADTATDFREGVGGLA